MKLLLLCALALLVGSCGSKNTSGKPTIQTKTYSPLEAETNLRKEFYSQGREVLRTYHHEIRDLLGDKVYIRMNRELRKSNISFSRDVLTNDQSRAVRSFRTVEGITILYIGEREADLNWSNRLYMRDLELQRLILHELIEMAGIDDTNLRYSKRIIGH